MNVLPETRQAVLLSQLHVLTLERLHLLPVDLTLAGHPDRGLGGSSTLYELQQSRRASVRGD
jgi:hypothetical protein